jgi:hypothetical protein
MPLGFNLRQILRTLRRNPLFTTVAIFCLAIGIGANTAIFSIIAARPSGSNGQAWPE